MNVLITSSSTKVLLVKSFKEAAIKYGISIYTADVHDSVATAFFSDKHFVLPRNKYKDYFKEELLKICKENKIGLIIPTRDGELEVMSEVKDMFREEGIRILVPNLSAVKTCLNKKLFHNFLIENGMRPVPIIETYTEFPLFVRPVYGSAGIGAQKVDSLKHLNVIMDVGEFLVHPYIPDNEYSIDLLMDMEGKKGLQAVCRERVRVIGGESKISRTAHLPILESWAIKIGETLGLVGHNVIQGFYSEKSGPIIIEANARFGGASNLGIKAGLDSPERILKMYFGDPSGYTNKNIQYGLAMYRYSEDVFRDEGSIS